MTKWPVVIIAFLMAPVVIAADNENHPGKAGFRQCAACHLAQGQGIPGAFPPLKGHISKIAALPEGRRYLVEVVSSGLLGPISVNGISYFGTMPAQGASFDAKGISDVLNYSIQVIDREINTSVWTPYTPEEVEQLTAATPAATAQKNAQTRALLAVKYPNLF